MGTDSDRRVMRLTLPAELVRQMDTVINAGAGGYRTRTELIEDAIRQQVELLLVDAGGAAASAPPADQGEAEPQPLTAMEALEGTALNPRPVFELVLPDQEIGTVRDAPLFGFHNRDYPSLWAACFLTQWGDGRPAPLKGFLDSLTAAAWEHAKILLAVQRHTGSKATALFPANQAKKKSAESAFLQFAVGGVRSTGPNAAPQTSGPLFVWRITALTGDPAQPQIGLTPQGAHLLQHMAGLTVEEPHPHSTASVFLHYLRDNAAQDHQGLLQVLRGVGDQGCDRQDLIERMRPSWPDWKATELSTNTAGYVARAREWGLLRPRLEGGHYRLTDYGHHYLNAATSEDPSITDTRGNQ